MGQAKAERRAQDSSNNSSSIPSGSSEREVKVIGDSPAVGRKESLEVKEERKATAGNKVEEKDLGIKEVVISSSRNSSNSSSLGDSSIGNREDSSGSSAVEAVRKEAEKEVRSAKVKAAAMELKEKAKEKQILGRSVIAAEDEDISLEIVGQLREYKESKSQCSQQQKKNRKWSQKVRGTTQTTWLGQSKPSWQKN